MANGKDHSSESAPSPILAGMIKSKTPIIATDHLILRNNLDNLNKNNRENAPHKDCKKNTPVLPGTMAVPHEYIKNKRGPLWSNKSLYGTSPAFMPLPIV